MKTSEITEIEETTVTKKQVNPYIQAIVILLPSILALVASSATNVCQPNIAGYFGATQYEAKAISLRTELCYQPQATSQSFSGKSNFSYIV